MQVNSRNHILKNSYKYVTLHYTMSCATYKPVDIPTDYNTCIRMIFFLVQHIETLKLEGRGVLSIHVSEVLENEDGDFILNPKEDYLKCDSDGYLFLDRPFTFEDTYMAPELKTITQLPAKLYYTCALYSLKSLALSVLQQSNLSSLYPTKLYYVLERTSVSKAEDRLFLFV